MSTLVALFSSLCFAELVHNSFEVWGMRQKVQWLKTIEVGKVPGHWPINVNTGLKTVVLHSFIIVFFAGIPFVLLKSSSLSITTLAQLGIVMLLINYAYTTWKVNQFHDEIGELIIEAKAKKKL